MEELDPEGLQARARRAIEESPHTQADVARELDVVRSSITQALGDTTGRFEKLRCRIVELLEPCEVERQRRFVLHPED
jgi:hypothetical protein